MPSVGITPAPIAPEEEERRVRMAQAAAAEEDTVSERPTQKKRKKRKKTKSSPRASEFSCDVLYGSGSGYQMYMTLIIHKML